MKAFLTRREIEYGFVNWGGGKNILVYMFLSYLSLGYRLGHLIFGKGHIRSQRRHIYSGRFGLEMVHGLSRPFPANNRAFRIYTV